MDKNNAIVELILVARLPLNNDHHICSDITSKDIMRIFSLLYIKNGVSLQLPQNKFNLQLNPATVSWYSYKLSDDAQLYLLGWNILPMHGFCLNLPTQFPYPRSNSYKGGGGKATVTSRTPRQARGLIRVARRQWYKSKPSHGSTSIQRLTDHTDKLGHSGPE